MKLPEGIYEHLLSVGVSKGIDEAFRESLQADVRSLDSGDSHDFLAQYLGAILRKTFASVPAANRIENQLSLANRILDLLWESVPESFDRESAKLLKAQILRTVFRAIPFERPDTPLSTNCLMTGTGSDPSLVSQLRKEIASADQVDILCSFIKWSGVRILESAFSTLTQAGSTIRLITTSYMGATDLKAIDLLHDLSNTEIRVSYDTRRTRLHAKAYIIHRESGFGVAYIGSSNLSQAALTDGLEWNVKISQRDSPHLWEKINGTFETYWNDSEFVPFGTETRDQLRTALEQERSGAAEEPTIVFFDIKPYYFQEEILDKLAAERTIHGRTRNLVVAATGTGKTVVAAFDYARFANPPDDQSVTWQGTGRRPRLLFVAHREEILKQSLWCFRGVLRDQNFGDLLVGSFEPDRLDHLFVSIQSFNSRELWTQVSPDFYDFIIVDEFHHAASRSYQQLLTWARPKVLLGLTATPERMDQLDVLAYFGGHIAAEIRLPDAIDRKLLAPFQYFGVTDSIDYSQLRWQRGGYAIEEIDNLVTGNDVRARLVIDKVSKLLLDPKHARGLGFCVSIKHAEYMASVFTRSGIPSVALSANSPNSLRNTVKQQVVNREINFIFVVDLYNEGVDIPEVDTILLLRPTESLTVFLQQLGRGLRLFPDKDCLTVLDFIGQAHANFNFEARFRALSGDSSRRILDEIEQGFPRLPAGCSINLERYATKYVLDNIRQAVDQNRSRLRQRLATFESETGRPLTLEAFVEFHRLDIDDIYKRSSWCRLLVEAGLKPDFGDPDEERLANGFRRAAHIDGLRQLRTLLALLPDSPDQVFNEPQDEWERRVLLMLHFTLWGRDWSPSTITESIDRLRRNSTLYAELIALLRLKLEWIVEAPEPLLLPFVCPLELHAHYTRDEILAALGELSLEEKRNVREGVLFVRNLSTDVFFVTLDKTEADYSPTTMYEDYAISDTLFHWQSQSTTSDTSPTGERYIHQRERGSHVLICVRERKKTNGLANPYTFLGPASYVSHAGSRPMSITWKLKHRIAARLLREVRRLAG